jgi:serine phosphatase RsbU (regulator of sigma subunit)
VFFEDLPWIVGVIGAIVALAAALLTDRLVLRRRRAEDLAASLDLIAGENRRLYAEQRGIAEELQHALLPASLPEIDGLQSSARYISGSSEIDIGGDWYDLVEVDEGTVVLVVGDVSGRGLHAATTMASLRNAVIAYAAQRDGPGALLGKLDRLVRGGPHDYFATVLCLRILVRTRSVTVASAGHLAPLEMRVGAPVGTGDGRPYEEVTVTVGSAATLLAYTDGLIERRGEVVDVGLERLRAAAMSADGSLDRLVSRVISELHHEGGDDDTAILGVRWTG